MDWGYNQNQTEFTNVNLVVHINLASSNDHE